MPTHFHAIVWIDHSQARIFHIGLFGDDEIVLHPHLPTRHLHHKANTIGSGHTAPDLKFLAQVMDAVRDAGQILITGPSTAKTELARYLRQQDSKIGDRIVAVEASDHPSDGEIIAYARQYFGMGPTRAGTIRGSISG
jgi:stalled ribosome rescue protein Dom34